ncbi:HAD family hydrolase [Candidatus Epulonipiscioides gigas]|nr:HAD family hydrolase [Epulopiscium sp. SCG-C07WGA-EpuloA2]
MDYKAVIFDLDGTLVDSMWVWEQIDIEFLQSSGHVVTPEIANQIEGAGFTETAIFFKDYFKLSLTVDEIKDIWKTLALKLYRERVELKTGVKDFLQYLENRGIKMAIATSNGREIVEAILEKHDISKFFNNIVTSCEVEKGKPHPFVYLKTAEFLGVEPDKCLVFEDVPNGIIAAKAAGMTAFGIEDIQNDTIKQRAKELADRWVIDYNEVIEIFKVN